MWLCRVNACHNSLSVAPFLLSVPVLCREKFVQIEDTTRFICNANGTDGEVSLHSVPSSQDGSTTVYGGCLCAVGMADTLLTDQYKSAVQDNLCKQGASKGLFMWKKE